MARRVLVIGLDPERVPGPWDPTPVLAGLAAGRARFAELGIEAHECLVGLDDEDVAASVTTALRSGRWDVVVVGGGIRKREDLLVMFEDVVNLVRRHAPDAALAFNSTPDDCPEAACRVMDC